MLSFPIIARGLLLALILVALWNPRLPWQAPPLDLMILIDASQSVDAAARAAAWREVAAGARRMPAGSRVAVVRFAGQAVEELKWTKIGSDAAQAVLTAAVPPHDRYVDDTRTDIAAAIAYALHLSEPGRNSRIVLISDGRATTGRVTDVLQLARQAGIAVDTMVPPAARGHDSWIASLAAPTRIHAGEMLPVTVSVASRDNGRGTVVIRLDGAAAASHEVMLSSQRTTTFHVNLPLPEARTAVLSAELQAEGDSEPRNDRVTQIVNIEGVAPVLYVSGQAGMPRLARSLRTGGWDVQMATPAAFMQRLENAHPGSIVLDDVAIADMPAQAWMALTRKVTEEGVGLLVLGGPHSFGAGGYRHSRLEDILPVTAEARDPLPPAAVLFMLDTSGSMDRHDDGPSRLELAREAMLESAYRLQPNDAVGLIEFAAEPHLMLPLEVRNDTVAAIRSASQSAPAGGTRLGSALREAVTTLAGSTFKQKLLVLVTDGYVGESDFGDIAAQIKQAGIDTIALAIGRDADTTALQPLTRLNNGQLLRVDQVAQLPRLMRHELDKRRSLTATGHFIPELSDPVPFLPRATGAWPALTEYAVTRERSTASVFLRVAGDPLFAARYAGAGRVAVITTSLDDWRQLWTRWPHISKFVGGLLDWIDAQHGSEALHLSARQSGGKMLFTLDTPLSAADGSADNLVLVQDPSGHIEQQALSARAPGRYVAQLATAIGGRYHAVIRAGDRQLEHDWLYGGNDEFMPPPPGADNLSDWVRSGLVQPWSESALTDSATGAMSGTLRAPLLIMTALLYLLLLLWERRADLVRSVLHKLGRASRTGLSAMAGRLGKPIGNIHTGSS